MTESTVQFFFLFSSVSSGRARIIFNFQALVRFCLKTIFKNFFGIVKRNDSKYTTLYCFFLCDGTFIRWFFFQASLELFRKPYIKNSQFPFPRNGFPQIILFSFAPFLSSSFLFRITLDYLGGGISFKIRNQPVCITFEMSFDVKNL